MGRQKHSDSYPEYSKSLYHIIKHHPLCHHFIQKRQTYNNCDDGETSVTGTVLAQRDEAFSCDKRKNLSLAKLSNLYVEEKVTPHSSYGKGCSQCDATSSSDYSDCNLCCKHHQHTKNDLLVPQVNDKKKHKVESYARKHLFGVSTRLCKHFGDGFETTNMNKKILLTFRHDPVFPLVYHFHKQQHLQRAKMTLNRSESFPFPYSLSKTKGIGRLYSENKTRKPVQFVSSRTTCEQVMPSVAKAKVNGNFNMNDAVIIVRDVKFSSVSAKGQNSLKQKIEHVTGESGKEKIRVAMDSVIHKLPQGQRISDELKNEILKKLTDPITKREVQHKSFIRRTVSSIRRTVSLQEPLESYCKTLENSFKTVARTSHSEKLKLEKQKAHSPLRMLIPLQRILSLPDLQSFSYASQKGDFSDFTPENHVIIDKNDLLISNIVKSSGCHILHKVWTLMSKSLCLGYKVGQKIDDHVSRDLAKNDGWVNIQFYDECFGLEVDHMIFHDLLKEIVLDLACL
ncbi:hypothetical protein RYX36_012080 [Vicia faba]